MQEQYKPLPNPDLRLSEKDIVVAARCRPMLQEEVSGSCSNIVNVNGATSSGYRVLITEPPPSHQEIPFSFDLAYQDHIGNDDEKKQAEIDKIEISQQERVVNDVGSLIMHAGWTGQSVSVFVHGARKTGKSYLLFGKKDRKGLIPRIAEDLFYRIRKHTQKENEENNIDENRTTKTDFVVTFSMVEVYLEKIRDLLAAPVSADAEEHISVQMSASVGATGLRVCDNHYTGGTYVADLTGVRVENSENVIKCLAEAEEMISLDIRKMNSDSRGHIIAQLNITVTETILSLDEDGNRHKSAETRWSNIRFCDLAEQEAPLLEKHQPKCHMREIRLKNKGITGVENCLRSVVSGLANPNHPHYNRFKLDSRSSVVTRVMFDASKFLLINCFSPADFDFAQSFSTLQYGQRCFSDRRDNRGKRQPPVSEHAILAEIEELEVLLNAERKKATSTEEELIKLKQVHAEQLVSARNELAGAVARNEIIIRTERENDAMNVEIKDLDLNLTKYSARAQELLNAGFSFDLTGEIFRLKQKIAETRNELELATRKKTKTLAQEKIERRTSATSATISSSRRASVSQSGAGILASRRSSNSGSVVSGSILRRDSATSASGRRPISAKK